MRREEVPVELLISPLAIGLIAAAIGAVLLGAAFVYWRGRVAIGLTLGAVGGGLGSLIFMLPLDYCTFETETERVDRYMGIALIAVGMALVLSGLGWISRKWIQGESLVAHQSSQGKFRQAWLVIPLLAPTLTILAMFLYYPSMETVRLSTMLSRLGARREVSVCVSNYTRLIDDTEYHDVVYRTFTMSASIVVLSMAIALLIATMAHLPLRGVSIYRTLLVWPYAISPAVTGIIFLLMFNPAGGIINYFLVEGLGARLGWLNDPDVAPWTIIISSVWKSLGFNILFYIAALQNVPKDLIEAAAIDGANVFQRFFRIVWPLLSPTTFFLLITNITYAFFETYATIDYLTPGGGPLGSTTTMMYRIIQTGVENNDLGKAAAQSIVLFITVIAITALLFRTGDRQVTYGA